MGRKKTKTIPGLRFRGGVWHIEKTVLGKRLFESTGTDDLKEAQRRLIFRLDQIRQAEVYGVRPRRTFAEAATKYLTENQHKRSIEKDGSYIEQLKPYIGERELDMIHMGCLQVFIETKRGQGVKNRTINYALQIVRRILNLASKEWVDDSNLTWLGTAPKIRLLSQTDERKPYSLSWEEQDRLFALLPPYLRRMALFKVNTGLRDQEVCQLQWDWEYPIPELDTSIFVIPAQYAKNKLDRLVPLNDIALQMVVEARGQHPVYVFTRADGQDRLYQMSNKSWDKARKLAYLPVRVHDLKHTFGRRLRAAQVSLEDRQDLLGHKSSRITTHYSPAEIQHLIEAANRVCDRQRSTPTLSFIRDRWVANLFPMADSMAKRGYAIPVEETDSGKIPARHF
jgi:integrase